MAKADDILTSEETEFVDTYSRATIQACGGIFLRPIAEGSFTACVREAIRWIKSIDNDQKETRRIKVTGLYKQVHTGNSILLFYTVSSKNEIEETESISVKNEDSVD